MFGRHRPRRLWSRALALGIALIIAGLAFSVSIYWDARDLDGTIGQVLGTRDVPTESGSRLELLVAYETDEGDLILFAEPVGSFAPEVGDRVLVWFSTSDPPRALIARQRFAWPAILTPAGLLLAIIGLWGMRRKAAKPQDPLADPDID